MIIVFFLVICLLTYYGETLLALKDRKKIRHVIHVNGIRGKSTVSRLIDAGLRMGDYKVFSKTTGTLPMVINTEGKEILLKRKGQANIKEQLSIMHSAAKEGAEIFIVECMAIQPYLQNISQHRMLKADIGVITNIRLDHTIEMGSTLNEICTSLLNTVPKNGILFSAEPSFGHRFIEAASKLGSKVVITALENIDSDFDFPENIELALSVCNYLGVERETALAGMKNYKRDPYALTLYSLPSGSVFINGMSINDPQSTINAYYSVVNKHFLRKKNLILLINNRVDRSYRINYMIEVARKLQPKEIWLIGSCKVSTYGKLKSMGYSGCVRLIRKPENIELHKLNENDLVYAVGNIARQGIELMEIVKKGAVSCVQC